MALSMKISPRKLRKRYYFLIDILEIFLVTYIVMLPFYVLFNLTGLNAH